MWKKKHRLCFVKRERGWYETYSWNLFSSETLTLIHTRWSQSIICDTNKLPRTTLLLISRHTQLKTASEHSAAHRPNRWWCSMFPTCFHCPQVAKIHVMQDLKLKSPCQKILLKTEPTTTPDHKEAAYWAEHCSTPPLCSGEAVTVNGMSIEMWG